MNRSMIQIWWSIACLVSIIEAHAQGIVANNGAKLIITSSTHVVVTGSFNQTGATTALTNDGILTLSSALQNSSSATVQGNGTYKVGGNWDNSANFIAGTSTVEMTGTTAVTLNAGLDPTYNSGLTGANTFYNLTLNKTGNPTVVLTGNHAKVTNTLTLTGANNKIQLGTPNLTVNNAVAGYDATKYIVTNGNGKLIVYANSNLSFVAPIGVSTTSYTPINIKESGTSKYLACRVLNQVLSDGTSGSALTSGVVTKSWELTEINTPTTKNLTLTPQWNLSDEATLDATKSGVSRWNPTTSAWDLAWADVGARSGSDPYTRSRSNITEVGTFAVGSKPIATYVQLSAKVFLQGAYANANLMNDGLRALNLIPYDENKDPGSGQTPRPNGYAHVAWGGSETAASGAFNVQTNTNDNIVDWVFVELRDPSVSATILHTRAALLQKDGDIVNEDGTSPLKIYGVPDGNYYISIRHRNHLAVRTAATKSLSRTATTTVDFTLNLSEALATPSGTAYNALATTSDGKLALWGGNINSDGSTRRNGPASVNDYSLLTTYLGTNTSVPNIYRREDVNLNGTVTRSGPVSINDVSRLTNFIGVNTIVTQPTF